MPPPDLEAQYRLQGLVARACAKHTAGASLDPALLASIKAMCRQSDGHVQAAWEALWGQLRAPHAQASAARRRPLRPPACAASCSGMHSP